MAVSRIRHTLTLSLAVATSFGTLATAQDRTPSPTVAAPATRIALASSARNALAPPSRPALTLPQEGIAPEIASPSDLPLTRQAPAAPRERGSLASVLSSSIRVSNTSVDGIGNGQLPPEGVLPGEETSLPDGISRGATSKCVHWAPASICHYPLYFEDVMLERHGHQKFCRLQPLISGARFFATLPVLPYKQALQGPSESIYTLGNYRPGTPTPALKQRLPWDRNAAAVEAFSLGGLFWAAPL